MSSDSTQEVLQVEGMTCANCAQGIRNVLRNKGLGDAEVSFAIGEVSYTPIEGYSLDDVKKDIHGLGYKVIEEGTPEKEGMSSLEKRFLFCLIFTLPLLAHMVIPWEPLHNAWVQFALSLPVMVVGLSFFGKSAFNSLKSGVPNMDVLITMGAGSAFIYSIWGTIAFQGTEKAQDFLFFETAATIITLVLMGNLIEQRSVRQTGSAIKSLGKMQTGIARKVEEHDRHEHISEIPLEMIKPGDLLQVNEGDRIAADGIILEGETVVNEALLTGESFPIEKGKGDLVSGGTICLQGNFRFRALKAGKDTALSQIIELVKKAQTGQPEIQRIGDKVSSIFVPVVTIIALVTFGVSFFLLDIGIQDSIMRAIAVLVISCPCAMGLATPTAVMSGIGRSAKSGILFRDGKVIEKLAKVDTVVFDKTGTLTTGEFKISALTVYNSDSTEEIHSILLSLSSKSGHPISKSILKEISGKKAGLKNIQEIKGLGMKGFDADGNEFLMGSVKILKDKSHVSEHDLFLTKNEECIASLKLEDEIKPDAKSALNELHKMGIKTILLSGDSEYKCRIVAQELGIDQVFFRQSPEEKLKKIEELKSKTKVAMVGDGVNDAPALNLADVGISISDSSEVARNSAQLIVLEEAGILALPKALKLSKLSLRTIHQNLFWAFFYNVIAIPIAAVGLLNPMVAAFSMAFSDVVVIGNSILLQFRKLK
ncbi:MAG: cation-translocating P-type ATPase [Bacteroidia bacterium]